MSIDTAHVESSPGSARIGSFVVRRALSESQFDVVGADDGSYPNQPGVGHSTPLPDAPDARAELEVRLAKLRHLSHAALAPILESGTADATAFWIQAVPVGDELQSETGQATWPITRVRDLVTHLGAALQIAHDVGLSHGTISPEAIFQFGDGAPVLSGLGVAGEGPAHDQSDLARVAIDLLATKPWLDADAGSEPAANASDLRAQRLRDALSTCTLRVVNLLAQATDPDPAKRFASIGEFAAGFDSAVRLSAEDLVHSAFEAISAQNSELAQVLADKAELYDPNCEGLSLLKLQLHGVSPFEQPSDTALYGTLEAASVAMPDSNGQPLLPTPRPDRLGEMRSVLPPELAEGLPQEFLDAIAPQFQVKPVKKGINPMFILAMGGAGILLLLAAAGLATILLSGS